MMSLRPATLFVVACLAIAGTLSPACAQIPVKPDDDWTEQAASNGVLAYMSPADSDGTHVLMIVGRADPGMGAFGKTLAFDRWANSQVTQLAEALGTLRSHSGFQIVETTPPLFGPLVEDTVLIDGDDGTRMSALVYGYMGSRNWQPIAILRPVGMPVGDPRVVAARDKVKFLRRVGYLRVQDPPPDNPAPETPAVAPAPAPAPNQSADAGSSGADINAWGTYQTERALTRVAPCSADGAQVALTLMPAWNIDGEPLGEWFKHRIGPLVTGWSGSGLAPNPPQSVDGDSLTAMHQFNDRAGNSWAVWFRAVQRGNRAQMAAVIAPSGIGNTDPRVNAAYNYVRNLYAGGYTLLPEQAPVPMRAALDYNPAGANVAGALHNSGTQFVGEGYIGAPDVYALLDNGRAFTTHDGQFSSSSSRANWRRTETGFELDWPQLQRGETVAASCFSPAAQDTVATRPSAPQRPQTECRKVTRYRMETHTQMNCPIGFTCGTETFQVSVPYEEEVCN